jgi:hypothetical protein
MHPRFAQGILKIFTSLFTPLSPWYSEAMITRPLAAVEPFELDIPFPFLLLSQNAVRDVRVEHARNFVQKRFDFDYYESLQDWVETEQAYEVVRHRLRHRLPSRERSALQGLVDTIRD